MKHHKLVCSGVGLVLSNRFVSLFQCRQLPTVGKHTTKTPLIWSDTQVPPEFFKSLKEVMGGWAKDNDEMRGKWILELKKNNIKNMETLEDIANSPSDNWDRLLSLLTPILATKLWAWYETTTESDVKQRQI